MDKDMTFEQAMKRLDTIVSRLDTGEASLEESLELFTEGAKLLAFCNGSLEKAQLTVETLFPQQETTEAENGI